MSINTFNKFEFKSCFKYLLINTLCINESNAFFISAFKVNIFNTRKAMFKSTNPWNANNAIAYLLFNHEDKFHFHFPEYKIIKNELSEFIIFLNSGGVVNNTFYLPINKFIFNFLSFIDKILIFLFPKIFALNRSVVLKKIK